MVGQTDPFEPSQTQDVVFDPMSLFVSGALADDCSILGPDTSCTAEKQQSRPRPINLKGPMKKRTRIDPPAWLLHRTHSMSPNL